MKNAGRHFLVTQMHCAKCGGVLELSYDKPTNPLEYESDGITGGNKVEMKVFIEPCKKCMRPVEDLKSAMKTLHNIATS